MQNLDKNINEHNLRNEFKIYCDGKHVQCVNLAIKYSTNINSTELDNDFINKYINHILGSSSYYNCLHHHNNKNSKKIVDFLVLISEKFIIPTNLFLKLITNLSDHESTMILKNNFRLDKKYIHNILEDVRITNNIQNNLFQQLINFNPFKYNFSKYIFENITIIDFYNLVLPKIKNIVTATFESLISDFLNNNKDALRNDKNLLEKIIIELINKHLIIKSLYKLSYDIISSDLHNFILNNCIGKFNEELIIMILEKSNIKPNLETVDNLIKKTYPSKGRSQNAIVISKIIDMLIEYGLEVSKELVLKLLGVGCYINQIEKYNIEIDHEVLLRCSEINFFPYKFKCIPEKQIIINECGKMDNLENIKMLKEAGGIFTNECLVEACKRKRNGKLIKYLINECGIEPNDECIKVFQEVYELECLDLVIKNYNKKETKIESVKNYELNKNCTLIIEQSYEIIDKNVDFNLKNKIKKFFNYKKKIIKYIDLYELFLKYLVDNNLVISSYFVIDENLSNLLNLNYCSLLHIDSIDNILTYFITPVNNTV